MKRLGKYYWESCVVIHLFVYLCEEELESTIAELEENDRQLAVLKAEKDEGKGTFFPILNLGNKAVTIDKSRDNEKDVQEMEFALKELLVIPYTSFHMMCDIGQLFNYY